jgi:hypothetical protein
MRVMPMIRGLNKITESAGLGYMMSSYTAHTSFADAERDAKQIAADLLLAGLVVFAPIAYAPAIERIMLEGMLDEDKKAIQSHEFWMPLDERFFERCDYGLLAMTPGWYKSQGIAIEVFALAQAGTPIWFYNDQTSRIMTMDEVNEDFGAELEELLNNAKKLQSKHLNSLTARTTTALAEVLLDD